MIHYNKATKSWYTDEFKETVDKFCEDHNNRIIEKLWRKYLEYLKDPDGKLGNGIIDQIEKGEQ